MELASADVCMVIGISGGGGRMGVSQQSNEGIGSGPEDGDDKGILVLVGFLVLFFLYLVLFA